MDPSSQLHAYVQQCRSSGMGDDVIRQQLLQSGWSEPDIYNVLQVPANFANQQPAYSAPAKPRDPKRIIKGVLWILSPFIVLISVALLQVLTHFMGITSPIINILAILGGLAGFILLPVGPILGIIKLARQ